MSGVVALAVGSLFVGGFGLAQVVGVVRRIRDEWRP